MRPEQEPGQSTGDHESPRTAQPGEAVSGFPEPPGKDPGDRSGDREPHHELSNPAEDPDPTEWPDPYDKRPDPRVGNPATPEAERHTPTGATSTSEPHPSEDPEAGDSAEPPERDQLDE